MKEGGKVYCIKSYKDNNGKYTHLKNSIYTINNIDVDSVANKRIWIISEPLTTPHGYIGYIISGELYGGFHYFTEHFLTIKELRKQKLKKIIGNRKKLLNFIKN